MMRLHKEGFFIIGLTFLVIALIFFLVDWLLPSGLLVVSVLCLILLIFVLQFFRHPIRNVPQHDDKLFYSPADGKVVVIEERVEDEVLKDKRLMISIFMSITDVHCNRIPVSGRVEYVKHHPGRYLVAWHPKSSTDNERTTISIKSGNTTFVIRQIAGAMARRIRTYLQPGQTAIQGRELGFIKFGSRVDVFLPLDAKVKVSLNQHVKANVDVIAEM